MPSRRISRVALAVAGLCCGPLWPDEAVAQTWSFVGSVVGGNQFDAVASGGDTIHLISESYVQLDVDGAVLLEESVADGRQGDLDFPPAIAVGADGSVHVVTRHGGDFTSGHDIRYRRRNAAGAWDGDYLVGSPAERNYVVGVAWAAPSEVYVHTSEAGANVWGDLHLWSAGSSAATPIGDLGGIWRADADARMRAHDGRLALVSGEPDPDGTAYVLFADGGGNLRDDLAANQQSHQAGTGRRGFPDVAVDGTGAQHVVYGAEQTVFYNRYSAAGQRAFATDVMVFDQLGSWHLSTGLAAVAASPDGAQVLAVALRADGSQQAADSDLLWAYSTDGGSSWSAPADLGRNTDAGEGRHRPRLVYVSSRFVLLFTENGVSGISMAALELTIDGDGDGFDAAVDCDDTNASIHPGADEQCNGVDDDCDDEIDEGCSCEDGQTRRCGSDVGECAQGVQRCLDQQWGSCEGEIGPSAEVCDGLDNDCDGEVDEQCVPADDTTPAGAEEDAGGCGCRSQPARPAPLAWLLLTAAGLAWRRRWPRPCAAPAATRWGPTRPAAASGRAPRHSR